jgi:hypothetical protein
MNPGAQLHDGRYTVQRVLGEGAQGVTVEATDSQTGRLVAIKRFDVRGAPSWKDVELAERETRVLATLDHPLVPRYIEHFEGDGALYLVMEKVEGETLEALRKREGALSETEVRRFLACADRALSYLHGRAAPVVHRDVKPRNIVRRPDGSYVFVDFGAVSELLLRREGSTIVGTAGYMAPEQFQGRALPTTDVYAVGATALAALTAMEPENLPHKGLRIDVHAALDGRASPELIHTLERMVEPDPDLRPPSIGAALDGMNVAAAGGVARRVDVAPQLAQPVVHPAMIDLAAEDTFVRSLRKLLWTLWGLGWIIVPLVLSRFDAEESIPVVMFTAMAALIVVTWHKGALLRAGLRTWSARGRSPVDPREEVAAQEPRLRVASPPVRVDVDRQRVSVGSTALSAEETTAATEVKAAAREHR